MLQPSGWQLLTSENLRRRVRSADAARFVLAYLSEPSPSCGPAAKMADQPGPARQGITTSRAPLDPAAREPRPLEPRRVPRLEGGERGRWRPARLGYPRRCKPKLGAKLSWKTGLRWRRFAFAIA